MTTALNKMLSTRAVLKKVTGMQSAAVLVLRANNPLSPMELRRPPVIDTVKRGRKLIWYKLTLRKHPPCDKLFIDVMDCGTVGDTHPEEIVVDDVHALSCNEAYKTVQLPASPSSKGTASPSLHIKVNTGAGGNVLPLHVFQCLYPNQISPDGLHTGLDHVSTRLTAYNRSHILLYGALCGPTIWWPGGPDT